MQWIEFTIKTSSDAAEVVAERLAQLGAAGIATEDPQEMATFLESDDDTAHIDPSYVEDLPDYARIRAYFAYFSEGVAWQMLDGPGVFSDIDTEAVYADGRFPKGRSSIADFHERLGEELAYIGRFLSIEPAEITYEEVDELAWRDKWKEFYRPLHLSKRLFVVPSWEEFRVPAGAKMISLDPGSAFGTGSHETTQVCAEAMDAFMTPGATVLDLGTGSGILAIGAALLGARSVKAIDISEHAVGVCRENVAKNGVADKITCEVGELRDDTGTYDLITANLIAEILVKLAPEFAAHLNKLGLLICSGIVTSKKDMVLKAFRKEGFKLFHEEEKNDWHVVVFSH